MIHLRGRVEKKLGTVKDSEFRFAVHTLNSEINKKLDQIPTIEQMEQILIISIWHYRKNNSMLKEGR